MNSSIVRFTVAASLAASVLGAYASATGSAAAANANTHPDFAWSPTAKPQGTRLFVGNLRRDDNGSETAQFNPKELSVDQSVPWK